MGFGQEIATYQKRLPELKAEDGKFVVIHGDEVVGTYTSAEDAITTGYQKFGLEPFLVKQICAIEIVRFISRFVAPHVA